MSFISVLIIILLALFVACALLSRWLWRKGKYGKGIVCTLLVGVICLIYTAIYPTESFYREEFVRIAAIPLPDSATFLHKEASYPNFHGDYSACALVRLPPNKFNRLMAQLPRLSNEVSYGGIRCNSSTSATYSHKHTSENVAESKFIGFTPADSTVVFSYSSW